MVTYRGLLELLVASLNWIFIYIGQSPATSNGVVYGRSALAGAAIREAEEARVQGEDHGGEVRRPDRRSVNGVRQDKRHRVEYDRQV